VSTEIMRHALEYSKDFDGVIIQHAEDPYLFKGGVMNESIVSTMLGMQGIPSMCEDIMAARDIRLAGFTGGRLHIAHISAKETVALIREAKKNGVRVTCEVTPHHLVLTDEAVKSFDTDTKMNPPLRTEEDRRALVEALLDGTIDCIATDHAPHAPEEKEVEYNIAPFGIVGLETSLGLILTNLVNKGEMSWNVLIGRMAIQPRKILGLPEVSLKAGSEANFTIIDPEMEWTVDQMKLKSKSRNTPFKGWKLKGKAWGIYNKGMLVRNDEVIH
jgi:dihydroorotase